MTAAAGGLAGQRSAGAEPGTHLRGLPTCAGEPDPGPVINRAVAGPAVGGTAPEIHRSGPGEPIVEIQQRVSARSR